MAFAFDGVEKLTPGKRQQIGDPNTPEKDLPPILRGLNYDPNLIQPPAGAIKTTQKEFDKVKETMRKDPGGFAKAVNSANVADGRKVDQVVGRSLPDPVFNNPIELPENK